MNTRTRLLGHVAIDLALAAGSFVGARVGSGVVLWLFLGLLACSLLRLAADLLALVTNSRSAGLLRSPVFGRLACSIGAVFVTISLVEVAIGVAGRAGEEDDEDGVLATLPEEWKRRPAEVPGAHKAFWWHGELHVQNRLRMRQVGPWPPRDPALARILVLGDSLTYGVGVAADEAYPAVLAERLGESHHVEVLNLGVSGDQSEDVLRTVNAVARKLKPTLVVYGVCLNDYLPSRHRKREAALVLDRADLIERWFRRRSLAVEYCLDRWASARIALGFDDDIHANILVDFEARARRFRQDVAAMNASALDCSGESLVALVLGKLAGDSAQALELFERTQDELRAAGADLCPMDGFVERHRENDLRVSQWEAHPNVVAHRDFAEELASHLRDHPALLPFRRD